MNNTDWAIALNNGFIMVGLVGIILALVLMVNKKTLKKNNMNITWNIYTSTFVLGVVLLVGFILAYIASRK